MRQMDPEMKRLGEVFIEKSHECDSAKLAYLKALKADYDITSEEQYLRHCAVDERAREAYRVARTEYEAAQTALWKAQQRRPRPWPNQ